MQGVVDERALPTAAHTGDANETSQGEIHIDPLQVVAGSPAQGEHLAVAPASHGGNLYLQPSVQVVGGERVLLQHVTVGTLKHHLTAQPSGTGSHINDVVGVFHHLLVMFHHDDGVSYVAQCLERTDEAAVVALVQTDAGFVEDIQHVDQLGADLGGQSYALALAS